MGLWWGTGQAIGPQADSEWLFVVPWGMRKQLAYVDKRYGHPPVYITENGCDVPRESQIPLPAVLNDTFRLNFFKVSPTSQTLTLNPILSALKDTSRLIFFPQNPNLWPPNHKTLSPIHYFTVPVPPPTRKALTLEAACSTPIFPPAEG